MIDKREKTMSYEDRLQDLVDKGVMSATEAKAFQEHVDRLTYPQASGLSEKRRLPMGAVLAGAAAVLMAGVWLIGMLGHASATPAEAAQDVSQSMNNVTQAGSLGSSTAAVMALFLVLATPVAAILFFLAHVYNRLIEQLETANKTGAFVTAALHRRSDLLPALHDLAQEAMKFEETLQATVTEQRSGTAQRFAEAIRSSQESDSLSTPLNALMEAYPDLKSYANIQNVQLELARIESDVLTARNIHSSAVADFNANSRSIFGRFVGEMAGLNRKMNVLA